MPKIDDELKSHFDSELQKAMLNTMFTANWLRSRSVDRFKVYDLSPEQYNILRILKGAKAPMMMHDVKARMIDRAPNTTRLTDKLISKDLVSRERSEIDRRVVYVKITKTGIKLLETIAKDIQRFNDEDEGRLSQKDARELNRILDTWRG